MQSAVKCILLCLVLSACREPRTVTPAIYYWKTTYRPTDYELGRIAELKSTTIYLRFFDVDWDERTQRPVPVSSLRMPQMDSATSYIPTIFITQRTLPRLRKEDIPELANNIAKLAESLCKDAGIRPQEIQIDCDWTYKTKQVYFDLLRTLKQQPFFSGKKMSATIRLFQVKYITNSGVPPVDRGMLMCYNMGNMKKPGTRNSILDYDEAVQYLERIGDYPLPLDIALPLFDWPLLFRNNELKGILRDIAVEEAAGMPFLKKEKENSYYCTIDTLWKGYRLKRGDMLRMEDSEYADIEKIAKYTAKRIANNDMRLAFYHCDSVTLSKYSAHDLEKVISLYR